MRSFKIGRKFRPSADKDPNTKGGSRMRSHRRLFSVGLAAFGLVLLSFSPVCAQTISVITSVAVNNVTDTLTINGTGFGSGPKVTLGTNALTVSPSPTSSKIVATFPAGLAAGDYCSR